MTEGIDQRPALLTDRVAAAIRAEMGWQGIRQSQLARQLGENDTWLSMRLRGLVPLNLNELERIADALDVEVTDLLTQRREGRVLSRAGTSNGKPNERLARRTNRSPRRAKRTTTERVTRHPCPKRRPQSSGTAPSPAGPPSQRRPALI